MRRIRRSLSKRPPPPHASPFGQRASALRYGGLLIAVHVRSSVSYLAAKDCPANRCGRNDCGIVGWQSIHPARDVLVKAFALIAPDQPAALVDLPDLEPGGGGRAGMCDCLGRLRQENRSGRFNRGIRVWPPAAG